MPADGAYQTADMTLATLLAMAGFTYTLRALTQTQAVWVFACPPEKEEDLDDLLCDYDGFTHKVEPREFILRFAEVRSELFDFLPNSRRRRQSVAPAPAQ